jgi:hypothetical protein
MNTFELDLYAVLKTGTSCAIPFAPLYGSVQIASPVIEAGASHAISFAPIALAYYRCQLYCFLTPGQIQ